MNLTAQKSSTGLVSKSRSFESAKIMGGRPCAVAVGTFSKPYVWLPEREYIRELMTDGLMIDGLMIDGLMIDGLMIDGLMIDGRS